MHFTPAALALGLAAASASAEINTFFAPATVQPGTNVSVILGSVGSQQSVLDVSTVYGVGQDLYTQTLGLNLEEVYILGRGQSNQGWHNITQSVTIPDSFKEGEQITIAVAKTSVYGNSGQPIAQYNSVDVTTGSETSSDYVQGGQWTNLGS